MTGLALVVIAIATLLNTVHTVFLSKRINWLEKELLETKMRESDFL